MADIDINYVLDVADIDDQTHTIIIDQEEFDSLLDTLSYIKSNKVAKTIKKEKK